VNLHGKEGVDGSSPSEGFRKQTAKRLLQKALAGFLLFAGWVRAVGGGLAF
jgi:hypothetical protein